MMTTEQKTKIEAAQKLAEKSNAEMASHLGRSRQWWEGFKRGDWEAPLDVAVAIVALLPGLVLADLPWFARVTNSVEKNVG
jgi:hypothetical protein